MIDLLILLSSALVYIIEFFMNNFCDIIQSPLIKQSFSMHTKSPSLHHQSITLSLKEIPQDCMHAPKKKVSLEIWKFIQLHADEKSVPPWSDIGFSGCNASWYQQTRGVEKKKKKKMKVYRARSQELNQKKPFAAPV